MWFSESRITTASGMAVPAERNRVTAEVSRSCSSLWVLTTRCNSANTHSQGPDPFGTGCAGLRNHLKSATALARCRQRSHIANMHPTAAPQPGSSKNQSDAEIARTASTAITAPTLRLCASRSKIDPISCAPTQLPTLAFFYYALRTWSSSPCVLRGLRQTDSRYRARFEYDVRNQSARGTCEGAGYGRPRSALPQTHDRPRPCRATAPANEPARDAS